MKKVMNYIASETMKELYCKAIVEALEDYYWNHKEEFVGDNFPEIA
jgi:hypothetical protein